MWWFVASVNLLAQDVGAVWLFGSLDGIPWSFGALGVSEWQKKHGNKGDQETSLVIQNDLPVWCGQNVPIDSVSRDDYSYHVVAQKVFVVNIFCRQVFDHVNPQSLPLKFPRSLQICRLFSQEFKEFVHSRKPQGCPRNLKLWFGSLIFVWKIIYCRGERNGSE